MKYALFFGSFQIFKYFAPESSIVLLIDFTHDDLKLVRDATNKKIPQATAKCQKAVNSSTDDFSTNGQNPVDFLNKNRLVIAESELNITFFCDQKDP